MKPSPSSRLTTLKIAVLAVASFYFLAPMAIADVYRCQSPAGKIEFSDAPWYGGSKGRAVDVRPNVVDMSIQREQLLKAENEALKGQLAAKQASPLQQPSSNNSEAWRIDTAACRTAKHDYEISASSIDKNQAMLRARESAMYGACGMREPDRTEINIKTERSGPPIYKVPSTR